MGLQSSSKFHERMSIRPHRPSWVLSYGFKNTLLHEFYSNNNNNNNTFNLLTGRWAKNSTPLGPIASFWFSPSSRHGSWRWFAEIVFEFWPPLFLGGGGGGAEKLYEYIRITVQIRRTIAFLRCSVDQSNHYFYLIDFLSKKNLGSSLNITFIHIVGHNFR